MHAFSFYLASSFGADNTCQFPPRRIRLTRQSTTINFCKIEQFAVCVCLSMRQRFRIFVDACVVGSRIMILVACHKVSRVLLDPARGAVGWAWNHNGCWSWALANNTWGILVHHILAKCLFVECGVSFVFCSKYHAPQTLKPLRVLCPGRCAWKADVTGSGPHISVTGPGGKPYEEIQLLL